MSIRCLGSHAQTASLEEFPYSANATHSRENHNGQTDKTDQAGDIEKLWTLITQAPAAP